MAKCNECEFENPEGARFCSNCGSPLGATSNVDDPTAQLHSIFVPDASFELPSPDDLPPNAVATLIIREGPKKGSRIALEDGGEQVTIGRHPESSIFLDDVTVSRRHAIVDSVDGGFTVADAGSLNGTYVNHERVESQVLSHGDEVQVGKFKLVFVAVGSLGA